MQDLKRLRQGVWPIFLLVLIMLLIHLVEIPLISNVARRLQNSLHAPIFGVFAVLAVFSLRKLVAPARAYFMAATIMVIIAFDGEALQFPGSRDADSRDLAFDIIGITGFLAIAAAFDGKLRVQSEEVSRIWLIIVAAPLLYASIQPSIWYTYVLAAREYVFPQLLAFEHKWESEICSQLDRTALTMVPVPKDWPAASGNAALLHLDVTPYLASGFSLRAIGRDIRF